jgi:hypothetical protein
MVGVALDPRDLAVACEFFELFKTPWEPAVRGKKYHAVISAGGECPDVDADLTVVYSSQAEEIDRELGILAEHELSSGAVVWDGTALPIYGRVATFRGVPGDRLTSGGNAVECCRRVEGGLVHRIGYDLFSEVGHLLTSGQPVAHAVTPTLELHIALLRRSLVDAGVPFIEIPPRPHGYDFTCCLTHDIDFYGIRRHVFDRTLAGFVARTSVGTLVDLFRGRRSLSEAVRNWRALLSLPFVFAGLLPDFWRPLEHYATADEGRKSTFFLVPFRSRPGINPDGDVDAVRAVPYQVSEVREEALAAAKRGSELAVHGIDSWRDVDAGRAEMKELTSLTNRPAAGVRMHWLYFSPDAPRCLEAAGFEYDSTWGYNDAIGYRAGTSQVFRLTGCRNLMELPLSIMDSALLFSNRMGLAPDEAVDRCQPVVNNAKRFGGTLVVNWHDRSLVPERLWDGVYRRLLDTIGSTDDVWFATAREAVDWFRWRRSIRFGENDTVTACDRSKLNGLTAVPPAVVRVHRHSINAEAQFEELCISSGESLAVAL